jgi:hypothetical protein
MKSYRTLIFAAFFAVVVFIGQTLAQGSSNTKEFKRVDLSTSAEMEVISSISQYMPGEILDRHFHHGIESGYFIQGGMIQPFGEDPIKIPSGAPIMNKRGEHHAGFKVVGDTPLKIYTEHIVDKGKPLYDWVEK